MKYLSFVRVYPLSTFCILLIWVLSLTPFFPETPLDNVDFIDKYTHFIMYGGTCAVIWWEHLRHCRKIHPFHYVWRNVCRYLVGAPAPLS